MNTTNPMEEIKNDEKSSEDIKILRLFYVDYEQSLNEEECKIASDFRNMAKVIPALDELNHGKGQLFGIFGEKIGLKTCLYSLFPNNHTQIDSIFANIVPMPAIWAVYDSIRFVFLLISSHDTTSKKGNYFMVVMQQFLQDLCQNILICPSDVFFSQFSTEHSFHGKSYEPVTFVRVKQERVDIQPPQKVTLDDKNTLTTFLVKQHGLILTTNNTSTTYLLQKNSQKATQSSLDSKLNKLKESLQAYLDVGTLTLGQVLGFCQQYGIFLSKTQQLQMENIVSKYVTNYNEVKANTRHQSRTLIKELLGIGNTVFRYFTNDNSIDDRFKHQLYDEVTDWLMNPGHIGEKANEFCGRLIRMINNRRLNIKSDKLHDFISALQSYDRKKTIRISQENFTSDIYRAIKSENQSEVHHDIHQFYYNPVNDAKNCLQCLNVACGTPIQISLNNLDRFINISNLSESDRLDFLKKIEFVGCFKMNDGKSDIITIRRPNIKGNKLQSESGYTVLLHKSGNFIKVADFSITKIHVAYAFNQNSHTLVVYNINNGNIIRCSLNRFGQIQNNFPLLPRDCSKKPTGVTSLALTVSQDLLVLIDSNFNVYEIDITNETIANISLLFRVEKINGHEPTFVADNGDVYYTVQTIGERNPIFFFQAKSSIDIFGQNYSLIYSIKLEQHTPLYTMQVFTNYIDTYCVLFNANANEVYCIQNLISDTRIKRQASLVNSHDSTEQYIGNRLLDIIKQGEVQFGVSGLTNETQYHFVLLPEYSGYSDRITAYFEDLDLKAKLKFNYEETDLIYSSVNIEQLIKVLVSRVPLQLCTIEMGTLVPLNNGRRDKMDHLSSKSFKIEMKVREISFSYLDTILDGIHENIKIVGVIGRQSTGKSYLMNRLFGTRFAVAAGRCTDGIWMSYAFLKNTHFIILDCEGLFSDQRTDDEEIKLISFLAAVCDITILSQDLGFSRFQDRLFGVLSQAVDKIGKNDKLFQGILLVGVRDISDSNMDESLNAAERKFLDLQNNGKSGFLEQIFSSTFKVQLLHHFENKRFDSDIKKLRQTFVEHVKKDESTGLPLPCRWKTGKDLSDRLKILLVQLYTNDFIDSNEIQANMNLADLEEEMKRAWTRFDLKDEENIELKEQQIEQKFEDKPCLFKLNHYKLELDENSSDDTFKNICKFIFEQLRSIPGFSEETNEEKNKILSFINKLIPEVMMYRRLRVKNLMLERFLKKFPNENENTKEKQTKFLNSMEQYMLSFKFEICLKKCAVCDLKCIHNAQHTEEIKSKLEKKKHELARLEVSLKTTTSKDITESIAQLRAAVLASKTKENELHNEMVCLSNELKLLSEKENLEVNIKQCESDLAAEKAKTDNFTQKINSSREQMTVLLSSDKDLNNMDQLLHRLDEDVKQLVNPDQYKIDHLNKLIKEFSQNYRADCPFKDELLCFSPKQEQMDQPEPTSTFQLNPSSLSKMMTDNISNIGNYRQFIQQCSEQIKKQLHTEQQHLESSKIQIEENEQQIVDAEKKEEDIKKLIKNTKMEYEEFNKELSEINVEQETLSKELEKHNQSIDTKASSEVQKLKNYLKDHPPIHGQLDQNEELNKELNDVDQLLKTIQSYDEQIESINAKLSKTIKTKRLKETYVESLKAEDAEDIEDEENRLNELNRTIEDMQTTLNNITQEKTAACNNNTLLLKILNGPGTDIEEQQKNKQIRLTELIERSKQLSENIEQLQKTLSEEENRLKESNEAILKNKQVLDLQKVEHEKCINNAQHNTKLKEVETKLSQSLSEVEISLNTALEKLNKIFQAKAQIDEQMLLSNALTLATSEQNRLDTVRNDLIEQLNTKKSNDLICRYPNTQACKEKYDAITKEYDNTHSQTKKLEQQLFDMDVYPGLNTEIATLEKEAQEKCDCQTDHKCSGICQICSERDQTKQNKCVFLAGHTGDHKCDADHVCTKFCQICEVYGFPKKRCVFEFEHSVPIHHQCERSHQCPATCVCSDPCVILLEIKPHDIHRCNKTGCWKQCMFSCGNLCTEKDHNHDANAATVSFAIGTDIHIMKKHLCDQPHYCKGICDAPGVCKLEYREEPRKWTTESGIEFSYDQIEVEPVRAKCGKKIDVGKSSHDEAKNHICDGQHTCTERCPDCGSFCSNPFGHTGSHKTNHRNKEQHIFTSTNPTERIQILSNVKDARVRTYNVGESAKPENCSVSCKRRGRSHFHLIECPGGSMCWEKKIGHNAKHSNDIYYYGSDKASTKKYDQILCSVYWSLNKWQSPVNDAEQKVIDLCNTYCEKHVDRDENGSILKESMKGFCKLDAWHNGDHVFECQNDHVLLEMYRGIDVCFVIDTTGSMDIYFEKVKETITRIVEENPELMKKLKQSTSDFRFSIVDYRDHEPEADYVFHTCDFTTDSLVKNYITKLESGSGGDFPEAVLDALDAACTLTWRDNTDRLLFHILDAPPHGRIFTDTTKGEQWPDGCPCGKTAEGVLSTMKKKNIKYHVLPCSTYLKVMITEFKKYIDVNTLTFDDKITFESVIAKQVHQQLIDTEMTLKKT